MMKIPAQKFGRRWYTIFGLLSMDLIVPFQKEMGLGFIDISVIRPHIRQFVEIYEMKWEEEELLQQTFSQIARTTNTTTALMLYDWGVKQFPLGGSEGAIEFIWTILLQRLAGVGSLDSDPILPLPENKVKGIIQISQDYLGLAKDNQNLWQRIDMAETQTLSEWDKRIYSAYSTEDRSPMDMVVEVVKFQRFQQAWNKVKQILVEPEIDTLLDWGKAMGQKMNMPDDLVQLPD